MQNPATPAETHHSTIGDGLCCLMLVAAGLSTWAGLIWAICTIPSFR